MKATNIPTALVSFPSIIGTSNATIVKWDRVFLEGFGITVHGLSCPEGDRANLFATIGRARKPHEYIRASELSACQSMIVSLGKHCCT